MVIVIIMDDDVYYHTFQDGPMGVGLEPPPGESVGSMIEDRKTSNDLLGLENETLKIVMW